MAATLLELRRISSPHGASLPDWIAMAHHVLTQVVKWEAGDASLPFPVVAMGSVGHIYWREGLSPVMSQDHFLQAATHITPVVHRWCFALLAMGGARASSTLQLEAVTGVPRRLKCRLPESLCLAAWVHGAFSGPPGGTRSGRLRFHQ